MTATDETTTAPALDQRTAAFVLAVLDVVAKDAAAKLKDGKDIGARDYFRAGDRIALRDDDGTDLGLVWMTKPKPVAEVDDRAAFVQHLGDEDCEAVGLVERVDDDRMDEVRDVLREHAPHLLLVSTEAKDWAEAAALREAVKPKADPIPGVSVRIPRGSITVKLEADGRERIAEMIAAGSVDALAALPAKDGA